MGKETKRHNLFLQLRREKIISPIGVTEGLGSMSSANGGHLVTMKDQIAKEESESRANRWRGTVT